MDLGRRVGSRYADLRSLFAANATGEAREIGQRNTPDIAVSDVSWLPTIPNLDKIICAGVNYKSHLDELGLVGKGYPVLFPSSLRLKSVTSGHGLSEGV